MALQIALTETNVGMPAPEAYAKIAAFHYDAAANRLECFVNIYASVAARQAGKAPIDGGVFTGTPGSDSVPSLDGDTAGARAELYTWLKTLPKFAGATDVLVDPVVEPVVPPVEPPFEPPVP